MPITPKQASQVLLYAPYGTCVQLIGKPGSAKSAVVYQTAKRAGAVYVGKYTAVMDAIDARGVPYVIEGSDGKRAMAWATPTDWPTEAVAHLYPRDTEIRVTLDDWGQSPPPVRRATARAVYGDSVDRTLGDTKILPNVLFCATSNAIEDRAGVYQMESYAQNRVVDIRVEPDVDEWVSAALIGFSVPEVDPAYPSARQKAEAAIAKGMPDEVAAFVKWAKELLVFDANTIGPFQSARSLETLGKFIRAFDAVGIDGLILQEVASGTIGEAQAVKFMAFRALRSELPDTNAILRGENVPLPPMSEVLFILCTAIIRAGCPEHCAAVAKLINRLAKTKKGDMLVGVEVSAYLFGECLNGAATGLRGVREQPEAMKWLQEHGKYFMAR